VDGGNRQGSRGGSGLHVTYDRTVRGRRVRPWTAATRRAAAAAVVFRCTTSTSNKCKYGDECRAVAAVLYSTGSVRATSEETPCAAPNGGRKQGGTDSSGVQVHHEQPVRARRVRPWTAAAAVHYEQTVRVYGLGFI